jgi:hypothetical protein
LAAGQANFTAQLFSTQAAFTNVEQKNFHISLLIDDRHKTITPQTIRFISTEPA